jgi:serine protease Do
MKSRSFGKLTAILTLMSFAGGVCALDANSADAPPTETQKHAMNMAMDMSLAFEHASETIESSVVHIVTESENRRGFRQQTSVGSGVIADERGYILTNAHVVEAGDFLKVRLRDGRELPGELIAFGDSEGLRVGEWVLAVGSPFGFQQSVTAGIISAKGRGSVSSMSGNQENMPQRFQEFIQTDAAINPGNSGGPLVDLDGRVIGINTAILSRSGGNNGLGFAIPIDIAQAVMNRIIDNGRVDRGWLGVQMGGLEPTVAYQMGIEGGVVLGRVIDGGPASIAGLKDGDIVVSIGGRTTENLIRMGNAIMLARPGVPVEVEYYRDGVIRKARATLQDRDTQFAIARGGAFIEDIGFLVVPDEIRDVRGRRVVSRIQGFRVQEVSNNSVAEEAGLEPGDFLYEINGRSFEDANELNEFFSSADYDRGVRLKLIRDNARGYIDITKE